MRWQRRVESRARASNALRARNRASPPIPPCGSVVILESSRSSGLTSRPLRPCDDRGRNQAGARPYFPAPFASGVIPSIVILDPSCAGLARLGRRIHLASGHPLWDACTARRLYLTCALDGTDLG